MLSRLTATLVKEVVLEEGSVLETIGASCFQGCSNLIKFEFPETLTSIGRNGFYQTSLDGTVVVPNSVTYLGPGAFLSTKIEILVLGDGELTVGYNFAGTYQSTGNQYLKAIYMPTTVTFELSGGQKVFYKCANPVDFYIVGDDAQTLIETLKGQSTGSYMTFITEDEATESTGAGYGIIHTGYNRCEAFYNAEHNYVNANDPVYCMATCERCDLSLDGVTEHSLVIEATFDGEKYLSACELVKFCSSCSYVANETRVGAIIYWLGYSVPEETIGNTVGISQSYYIDKTELAKYESVTGSTVEYGIVAAVGTKETPITIVDGTVVADRGVIAISMTVTNSFEIKLGGIKSADFDTTFVFNCYVAENGEIKYVGGGKASLSPIPLSYNQIK